MARAADLTSLPWVDRLLIVGTAGLGVVAAGRLFQADTWLGTAPVIGLISGVPFVLLAVYPALLLAAVRRSWKIAGLLAVLGIAHLWWTLPDVAFGGSSTEAIPAGTQLTITTANLLMSNPDPTLILEELAAAGADVVVLNELTPGLNDVLVAAGSYDHWPHIQLDPHWGAHGTGLLSSVPFLEHGTIDFDGVPVSRAVLGTDSGTVEVVAIHSSAPLSGRAINRWRLQMDEYLDLIDTAEHRLVLIGDFNATRQHRGLQRVLDELTDVHLAVGSGLGATWPSDTPFPALLRIDRVLISDGLTPVSIRRGVGEGSDHRPVLAHIVVTDR